MLRALILCLSLTICAAPTLAQTPALEFARAEKAWDKEDYASAENDFSAVLKLSANDADDRAHAYFGRGLSRLQQEKWQGARDDLSASIELNASNAEAFASRGMARKAMGDYAGLLEDAERAAQIDPEYKGFEADAQSTVLWRRMILGFTILGCVVVAAGAVPMVRAIVRVSRAERQTRNRADLH